MDCLKANLSKIRVPGPGDRVFKDECVLSFDSPVCFSLSLSSRMIQTIHQFHDRKLKQVSMSV